MSLQDTPPRHVRPGWTWPGVLLAYAALHASVLLVAHWSGMDSRTWREVLLAPAGLVTVLCMWRVARRHDDRRTRAAWLFLSLAVAAWTLAFVVRAWVIWTDGGEYAPRFTLADLFFTLIMPFMVLGNLLLPTSPSRPLTRLKVLLDAGITLLSLGAFLWAFVFAPQAASAPSTGEYTVYIIYFSSAMAGLSLAVRLLFASTARHAAGVPAFLIGAMTFATLATLLYTSPSTKAWFVNLGSPLGLRDTLWLLSLACFASAARAQLVTRPAVTSDTEVVRATVVVPYLALIGVYGLLSLYGTQDTRGVGLAWSAGLATLLVLARQSVVIVENLRLTAELRALSSTLEERVDERTRELARVNAELHDLTVTLEQQVRDRTEALRASQEQLVASEKLAGLGRLTAGLAHEVNTPLAASMSFLHQARDLAEEYRDSIGTPTVTDDDHRDIARELLDALEQADASAARIGEFIRRMRDHTRDAGAGRVTFDAVRLTRDTLSMLTHEARSSNVTLTLEGSEEAVPLVGEPGRYGQILTNLVVNAMHATEPRGGTVAVRLTRDAEAVQLHVTDDGTGIHPDVLPRIFDPMFTTKDVGKGTGLGLSIIRDIVRGHFGGSIDVRTTWNEGTTFTVTFPLTPST